MKFTKEEARKELVSKMTAKGEKLNLSERSISEQLDTLMPLLDNDELEVVDFVEKVLPMFRTADANVRNDVSVGIRAYEEKHPKTTEPTPTPTATEGESELEKRIKAMEEELAKTKSERRVATLKAEVLSKLKEKGIDDAEWCESLLSIVSFDDSYDVDTNVNSYIALYNKKEAEAGHRTPRSAESGNAEEALKKFISNAKAYAEANDLK